MSFLNGPGGRLHVQTLGAGAPVVMLHGLLLGSLASWYFTAAPALSRRHQVTLFDLRGHGRSDPATEGYDTDTLVDDLEAVTAGLGGALTLVGHSYGGVVALKFALRHPRRVARLALVEVPLPPGAAGDVEQFLARDTDELLGILPNAVKRSLDGGGRTAVRFLRRLQFLATETTLLDDLAAETDIADARLASLTCPALLLYGDRSPCRPVGDRLAAVLPNAELAVLEGGHELHLDAAGEVTRRLVGFCGG